ncbi:LytR/AlgR family response regulator transcription factor [Hwangdonia lutea]|uniref:LytTR family DNA-binding domain-containing protein n=1 Tax=Hwangdonia lutea TaxID=3075823 RepID=A0AA97HQK3_9FLAO|nr:LytTR family DNA-binding domain-containing protein [Hwangdonia sp. SCSIO 19198]WOD44041.1 LytTR family DNA-binding domain-containing protein [Hwangdonia sp. SCSIO 19198]
MTRTCIIIDDEKTARNIIKTYIAEVSFLELKGAFKNAIEALEYLQSHSVDLLFLDIEMPKLSGLNFAKIIGSNTQIIFTTAHREFALDGFELNAVDYLLKPFSFDRFLKAVQKTQAKTPTISHEKSMDYMFIKVNKQMLKIDFDALLYIEGLSNYVKIQTHENAFVVYDKLSALIKKLPAHQFIRIHKSYIINVLKIKLYTKEFVEIDGKHIPVSATYRASLMALLKTH